MNTQTYSFQKALLKVVWFLLAVAPLAVQALPEKWMNLTLGALIIMAINAVKFWYSQNVA